VGSLGHLGFLWRGDGEPRGGGGTATRRRWKRDAPPPERLEARCAAAWPYSHNAAVWLPSTRRRKA